MKRLVLVCGFALAVALAPGRPLAAQSSPNVTASFDKGTDFSKLKTYTWEHGWQAFDKSAHEQIQAAVDRELGALGLQKRESGPSDMLVTYASIRRTDVDVKSEPNKNDAGRAQYDVGTLVVLLLEPGTRKELFRARVDRPISAEPEKLSGIINTAIADIFAKYPNRPRK